MKTQVAAEAVLTEIADLDIFDLCNLADITLQSDGHTLTEGVKLLTRVRAEFLALIEATWETITVEDIALSGADLFENCLPEWNCETLEAVIDLASYGEELPEGYGEQLDLIGQAELALIIQCERLWQALTEIIARHR